MVQTFKPQNHSSVSKQAKKVFASSFAFTANHAFLATCAYAVIIKQNPMPHKKIICKSVSEFQPITCCTCLNGSMVVSRQACLHLCSKHTLHMTFIVTLTVSLCWFRPCNYSKAFSSSAVNTLFSYQDLSGWNSPLLTWLMTDMKEENILDMPSLTCPNCVWFQKQSAVVLTFWHGVFELCLHLYQLYWRYKK